ncbi:MAG: hypothetical protein AVDCRST_MAG50-3233 [uncultured Acidimicrobiales bacterium]|uniref:DUF4157 domain-containing protein n=1 Tax=uncultured Acidimicrobiales bacterium TaxID=310071 RepID=A0A6J4J460_9ACTN|nr:MAG: hypothetical protein AVDCRST_MAG50-3233 [uncultured Acidimicrobiales bacterium]
MPPGADAITLGSLIIVRQRCAGDRLLLEHERVHVRQWRRHGVVGFLVRYLGAYLRARLNGHSHGNAYLRIPLEVEAEWTARRGMAPPYEPLAEAPADG